MKKANPYLRLKMIAVGIVLLALSFTACEKFVIESTEIDPNAPLSFSTDIIPIFEKNNCASCHGGGIAPDLRSANAYASLKNGGFYSVSAPATSKIMTQLLNNSSHQSKTTPEEEQKILYWITQGAKNN